MSRFKTSGEFEVDSVCYAWAVRHYGGASTPYENQRGVSVSVWLQEKRAKELIVDFPFGDYLFNRPKSTAEFEDRLRRCLRGAIRAGWNPGAKGKPFRVLAKDAEGVPGR